jgi:hypothetical protein
MMLATVSFLFLLAAVAAGIAPPLLDLLRATTGTFSLCSLLKSSGSRFPVFFSFCLGVKIALLSLFQGLENKSKRNENHVRVLCGRKGGAMVRISVLNDALKNMFNAEKRGKRQVLLKPSSKVIIKFLTVMQKHGTKP